MLNALDLAASGTMVALILQRTRPVSPQSHASAVELALVALALLHPTPC